MMDGILHLLGFEAMQIRDFFVLLDNTFCQRLFHTMDVALRTNYFEHERGFLNFLDFSGFI